MEHPFETAAEQPMLPQPSVLPEGVPESPRKPKLTLKVLQKRIHELEAENQMLVERLEHLEQRLPQSPGLRPGETAASAAADRAAAGITDLVQHIQANAKTAVPHKAQAIAETASAKDLQASIPSTPPKDMFASAQSAPAKDMFASAQSALGRDLPAIAETIAALTVPSARTSHSRDEYGVTVWPAVFIPRALRHPARKRSFWDIILFRGRA